MRERSQFGAKGQKTKNPAGARFLSAWLQVVAASTLYYVNAKSIRDRCSSRNLRSVFLCHRVWMRGADLSKNTVHPYSIYLYWVCSLCAIRGRKFDRRNEVLAETGGAVSALTPREHTVLRQQRAVTGPRGNAWFSAAHPCRCRRRAGKPFMERTNYRPGRRRRRQAGISWQRAAERYVSLLCSLTTGDARMGGMDIIILILKLMVAVLQLLDAVLKQFR